VTQATVTRPAQALVTSGAALPDRLPDALVRARAHVPVGLVVLASSWWLLWAPRLWGGRGAGAITGGAILTALAVVAIRPDRVVPRFALGLAAAVSVGAFVVALTAPTGWKGAPNAADYVCAAWMLIAVAAAVAREPRTVEVVCYLLVGATLVEVAEAWLPWWGGASSSVPMIGTFYWYNPFAVFLISGAVIGLSFWLTKRGSVALLGLLGFTLGSIGLVYSTSRASDACFVVAVAAVSVTFLWRGGWAALRRTAEAVAVAAFGVWVIAGPPFFSHRGPALGGTVGRSAAQSIGRNGGFRLRFMHDALNVFSRFPLTGGGYHSLAAETVGHVARGSSISPLAHNGYLQPLSDGGLVLGIPFLLGCAFVAWFVLRSLVSAVWSRDFSAAGFVLPLCLGALMLHSAVDFDWSFPADFLLVAVLAGVVAGRRWSRSRAEDPKYSSGGRVAVASCLVGVALLSLAAVVAWSGDLHENLPIHNVTQGENVG
jgi:O-antigen ligase/polysaccharide polymerase Wzy-like membrane protein